MVTSLGELVRVLTSCSSQPNRDNIVKFAIHGPGYLNPDVAYDSTSKLASTPRTKNTPLHMQDNIPREAVTLLRTCLVKVGFSDPSIPEVHSDTMYPGLSATCRQAVDRHSTVLVCRHPLVQLLAGLSPGSSFTLFGYGRVGPCVQVSARHGRLDTSLAAEDVLSRKGRRVELCAAQDGWW